MGYLRGTKGSKSQQVVRVYRNPKTLSQEVQALKRQVALNRNESYFYRQNTLIANGTVANWHLNTIDVTNSFCTSSTYHDNVTGDAFLNNNLDIKVDVKSWITHCRMIVYVSKNPNIQFTPVAGLTGFVTHPEPNSFWVLKDVYINHQADTIGTSTTYWMNLRKLKTIFNTDENNIEKGRIRILFLHYNSNGVSTDTGISAGVQLSITDK